MLRPRIIPCLLVRNSGLVKTVRFSEEKYVGDPVNAVRIFNEKVVDELMVLDIDATVEEREPNYELVKSLAAECQMPLCYGGGVHREEQFERLISLGVEKVALSSAAIADPGLISRCASRVGSQSVVVVMDVKKSGLRRRYELFTHNGTRKTGLDPVEFAAQVEDSGAGEVVINSIDRDGMMCGYEMDLVASVRERLSLPITVLGGAGSVNDVKQLFSQFGTIGAAAGSLFVFKGKYRAVLINYPDSRERASLCATVS